MLKRTSNCVPGSNKSSTYSRGYASGVFSPVTLLGKERVLGPADVIVGLFDIPFLVGKGKT
jgi:hypothetical protein